MATPEGYVRSPEDEAMMARARAEAGQDETDRAERLKEAEALQKEKAELEERIGKIDERMRELFPGEEH